MIASLRRAGQLGMLATGLADVRCRRAGPSRNRAVRRIVDRLGLMHGLPQKIGQLLSFAELDTDHEEFSRLTEQGTAMPTEQAFAEMERQLGLPLDQCFAFVDRTAISASIGQVHRARLHDGRDVAVKIQYPDIAAHVKWDLHALGWLTEPVGGLRRGFDLDAYRSEIGGMLQNELDYTLEAEHLRRFARWTNEWPGIVIPEVISELSGPCILTMTWITGERPAAARTWPLTARHELSESLLALFLHGCFRWGSLHADLHSGNLRVLRGPDEARLGLLDFGCVTQVPPDFAAAMSGLIRATRANGGDEECIRRHFLKMGFSADAIQPMKHLLPAVAKKLFEPFVATGTFDVTNWNVGPQIAEILGPHRMTFRLAGPPEMVFFLRAFHGLTRQMAALGTPVDWRAAYKSLDSLQSSEEVQIHAPNDAINTKMKSETLHIQVTESGQTRVAMTFGAAAADNLPDLVPVEMREKLRRRSINLVEIAENARRGGYAQGELFSLRDGEKTVRVWLD